MIKNQQRIKLSAPRPISQKVAQYAKQLTQQAAFGCYKYIGKGDEKRADKAAVDAMRKYFDGLDISGRIVIGEGERDEAPMLYINEELGAGGEAIDIAVDPLEGTTICAHAMPGSLSVIAMAPRGKILHAPDIYMEKIAIGINTSKQIVDLDLTPQQNLSNLAKYKKCDISDLTVCILKRPRHEELIAQVRKTGARIKLISDGDVAAVLSTTIKGAGVDIYMGTGGAPEGVLAAAALACIGGQMQGRFWYQNEEEKARVRKFGFTDINQKFSIDDMIPEDVIFAATGVTTGSLLSGVKIAKKYQTCQSLVMHRSEGLVSKITDKYLIK